MALPIYGLDNHVNLLEDIQHDGKSRYLIFSEHPAL